MFPVLISTFKTHGFQETIWKGVLQSFIVCRHVWGTGFLSKSRDRIKAKIWYFQNQRLMKFPDVVTIVTRTKFPEAVTIVTLMDALQRRQINTSLIRWVENVPT